jgi:glutathione synthase/RimK-type ligase-like ATP-grasp enzyme
MKGPHFIVVEKPDAMKLKIKNAEVISARRYLTDPTFANLESARIFNLCKSYRYQSKGYYVSLLAQARKHKVIPDTQTIQDMKDQKIAETYSLELDELIQKKLKKIKSDKFTISIYFGKNTATQYGELAKKLFALMRSPLLRADFERDGKWYLTSLRPIPLSEVDERHIEFVEAAADEYFARKNEGRTGPKSYRYDLAILHNPSEKESPSNQGAIENFLWAAKKLGIRAELVTKDESTRILEYDALFIRETTNVNHYTYRFARRAWASGLVVIDHPESILKCANKVFLEEILSRHKIPRPFTAILHRDNLKEVMAQATYPCILKQPDSAFSLGVFKAKDASEFEEKAETLLSKSDLVIVQEFVSSDYDWRIGVLDNKPLFACKYFMAKGHWQILNHAAQNEDDHTGDFQTYPISEVPKAVIETAVKASKLIGDGLYGIDLKQVGDKVYLIEVNDNPNIDEGIEDKVLGDNLYLTIMQFFLDKLNRQRKLDVL